MNQIRATACFRGRVQGVWFRAYTKQQADLRKVCGWVRNCPDGSVEALFEGEETSVRAVLAACQQGPPEARVEQTDVDWQPARDEFTRFEITR